MTASARPLPPRRHARVNKKFLKMLPRIRLMALQAFAGRNHELRYELTAEVIARAYAAFLRMAHQGKAHVRYATPLALFSIRQVKSGRRMGTKMNVNDVSSEHAQLNNGIKMQRLDHYDEEEAAWQEILVEDKKSGPAEIAASRIDFAAWLATLTRRDREVATTLSTGETPSATARKFGLSPARISQLRRQLNVGWDLFVAERPQRACAAAS